MSLASELQSGSIREIKIESLITFPRVVRDKVWNPLSQWNAFPKCQLAIGLKLFSVYSVVDLEKLVPEPRVYIRRVDSGVH